MDWMSIGALGFGIGGLIACVWGLADGAARWARAREDEVHSDFDASMDRFGYVQRRRNAGDL